MVGLVALTLYWFLRQPTAEREALVDAAVGERATDEAAIPAPKAVTPRSVSPIPGASPAKAPSLETASRSSTATADRPPPFDPGARAALPPSDAPRVAEAFEDEEPVLHAADGEGIQAAVRENIGEIKDCYEAWLKANPGLQGRIVVDFDLVTDPEDADSGLVTNVGLPESTVDHLMLEGCVGSVLEGLNFEAPDEGLVEVRGYPFVFSTE